MRIGFPLDNAVLSSSGIEFTEGRQRIRLTPNNLYLDAYEIWRFDGSGSGVKNVMNLSEVGSISYSAIIKKFGQSALLTTATGQYFIADPLNAAGTKLPPFKKAAFWIWANRTSPGAGTFFSHGLTSNFNTFHVFFNATNQLYIEIGNSSLKRLVYISNETFPTISQFLSVIVFIDVNAPDGSKIRAFVTLDSVNVLFELTWASTEDTLNEYWLTPNNPFRIGVTGDNVFGLGAYVDTAGVMIGKLPTVQQMTDWHNSLIDLRGYSPDGETATLEAVDVGYSRTFNETDLRIPINTLGETGTVTVRRRLDGAPWTDYLVPVDQGNNEYSLYATGEFTAQEIELEAKISSDTTQDGSIGRPFIDGFDLPVPIQARYVLPQTILVKSSTGDNTLCFGLPILKVNTGDQKTLPLQLREDDGITPVDISDSEFALFAKRHAGDVEYIIGPITATKPDALNGKFEFDIDFPSDPDSGKYWIVQTAGVDDNTFPPAEGTDVFILAR